MNGALPGAALDLIRDGVSTSDLKERGERAVFGALISTAMSAINQGWSDFDWESLVMEERNVLRRQVVMQDASRTRSPKAVRKMLADAWDRAVKHTNDGPAWTFNQVRESAEARALAALQVAEDPDQDLRDSERAVLAYAAQETRRRGLLQVALPWRTVAQATGLGERSTKNALRSLQRKDLLRLARRGRGGDPTSGAKVRANLYALTGGPAAPIRALDGPMGPPPQTYGTPGPEASGTPPQTYGTPQPSRPETSDQTSSAPTKKDDTMRLTMTPDGVLTVETTSEEFPPERVLEALEAAGCRVEVRHAETSPEQTAENVIPLNRRAAQ